MLQRYTARASVRRRLCQTFYSPLSVPAPHITELPHKESAPHITEEPPVVPAPHITEEPPVVEAPHITELPLVNCELPQTAGPDQAADVPHTEDLSLVK